MNTINTTIFGCVVSLETSRGLIKFGNGMEAVVVGAPWCLLLHRLAGMDCILTEECLLVRGESVITWLADREGKRLGLLEPYNIRKVAPNFSEVEKELQNTRNIAA